MADRRLEKLTHKIFTYAVGNEKLVKIASYNILHANDQNIVVLVEGMFHSNFHFVYHVIVFNFHLRKIVLQEVGGGGFIIFKRDLI
jgi:hypothetical protein